MLAAPLPSRSPAAYIPAWMLLALQPNPRAKSLMPRLERTNSTNCRRNAAGYGGLVVGISDSVLSENVSAKSGKRQLGASMRWRSGGLDTSKKMPSLLEEFVAAQFLDRVEVAFALRFCPAPADPGSCLRCCRWLSRCAPARPRRRQPARGRASSQGSDQDQAGGCSELVVELSDLDRAHGQKLQTRATHRNLVSSARRRLVDVRSRIQE